MSALQRGHGSRRALLTLIALGLLDPACKPKREWPPSPIEFVLGEDVCDACRMTISDGRFGAQLHSRGGAEDVERFDDLGCLLGARREKPLDLQAVFVRVYDRSAWVRGDRAWIARSTELKSPMGYGLAAFSTEEAARAEASRHADGSTSTLAELTRTPVAVATDVSSSVHEAVPQGEP